MSVFIPMWLAALVGLVVFIFGAFLGRISK